MTFFSKILSLSVLLGSVAQADTSKVCRWIGGNDSDSHLQFQIEFNSSNARISKASNPDNSSINGAWKFKRKFEGKDGQTYLEYRLPKDEAYQAVIEPKLLQAGTAGILKFWYNNGDGFVTNVFRCGDR